ncbi:cytochrome P460 family protein [Photobacterium atrarenae]|uniref:Cytochrome P460 family protein n=1 Tax=Photobacterium atrarenae TaxID=865757 RepID=A0ABY5GL26_9GAMM|nr:cytochrome P460 family protein [Photobacterium atrarenae]UTV29486.1 cytochrome P460 family protein [Photobacterium atrarenae]
MQCYNITPHIAFMIAIAASPSLTAEDTFSPYVDKHGNILFPTGFRTSMVHLGSWFIPHGEASGFHDVYTEQATITAFRKTGKFPDGATLVKELRTAKTGHYTTGRGISYATPKLKEWFVMVKDSHQRFPDNPQWGDGWGWALYKPDAPEKNLVTDYKVDCLGCHIPAKQTDWIYEEGYPVLKEN